MLETCRYTHGLIYQSSERFGISDEDRSVSFKRDNGRKAGY